MDLKISLLISREPKEDGSGRGRTTMNSLFPTVFLVGIAHNSTCDDY